MTTELVLLLRNFYSVAAIARVITTKQAYNGEVDVESREWEKLANTICNMPTR